MKTKTETKAEAIVTNPYATPSSVQEDPKEVAVEFKGRVYNTLSMSIATIFGSVLAAGLLLYTNYSHFEQKRNALITVVITSFLTLIFLFGMLIIDFPVVLLFLGLNFIIAASLLPLSHILQGKELEQHEEAEREFHTYVRAGLVGFGCLIAMGLMLFFAYAMYLMSF